MPLHNLLYEISDYCIYLIWLKIKGEQYDLNAVK